MQAELDGGESIQALRRFNKLLRELPADGWGARPPSRFDSQGLALSSSALHAAWLIAHSAPDQAMGWLCMQSRGCGR